MHLLVSNAGLVIGGSPVEFIVTLRNGTGTTYRDITPLVSVGHCTSFSSDPVPVAPNGTLTEYDPATAGWRAVPYDQEGTGMDYKVTVIQLPGRTWIGSRPAASISTATIKP